jgi:hypothetical protein
MEIAMSENGTQDSSDPSAKKSREKSVRYPAYGLEECVDFLKIVHTIGGKKEAPVESLLSKLKITTSDNRRYKYLTSSAEIFGLVKKTSNGITPTEFGLSILYPINGDEQRKQLYFEAFNTPQVYQKIIERYKDMILPDVDALKPIFYNSGIAPNALDTAVNAFLASAKFAGVLDQDNRLLSSIPEKGATPFKQHLPEDGQGMEKQKGPAQPPPSKTNVTQGESEKPEMDVIKNEIRTTSGKKASILLPKDWVKEDIETLIKLLRVFSPEDNK